MKQKGERLGHYQEVTWGGWVVVVGGVHREGSLVMVPVSLFRNEVGWGRTRGIQQARTPQELTSSHHTQH